MEAEHGSSCKSGRSDHAVYQDQIIVARLHGRDLRLRDGDIIIAIDGALNTNDIHAFRALGDRLNSQEKLLLTICRGEVVYDVFAEGRLGADLDYADAEASSAAAALFANIIWVQKTITKIMRRFVMSSAMLCFMIPAIRPLQPWHRQSGCFSIAPGNPWLRVIAAYATSLVVHWGLFAATAILMAIYFHRIQFRLIRNYSLFTEHYFWHVCAARTSAEAQLVCRQIDPKCQFDFSHVGPPETDPATTPSHQQAA